MLNSVTPAYILSKMGELGLHQVDLVKDLSINKSNISLWLSGHRPMSKPVKAMFYYYLQYKTL
jgi:hypothetical protein